MPDTLPGSDFDENGVCSWCRNSYPAYTVKGDQRLITKFKGLGKHSGRADCVVGLSGGKDSTYALYRLVRHYGLKAEALSICTMEAGILPFAMPSAHARS